MNWCQVIYLLLFIFTCRGSASAALTFALSVPSNGKQQKTLGFLKSPKQPILTVKNFGLFLFFFRILYTIKVYKVFL